jgi:hypothetical protein
MSEAPSPYDLGSMDTDEAAAAGVPIVAAQDRDGDGKVDFIAYDRDGDGVADKFVFDSDGDGVRRPDRARPRLRWQRSTSSASTTTRTARSTARPPTPDGDGTLGHRPPLRRLISVAEPSVDAPRRERSPRRRRAAARR